MDRRRILLVVAVVVAMAGVTLVFLYTKGADNRAQSKFSTVPVLEATQPINAGEKIEDAATAGKLTVAQVPQNELLSGAQSTTDALAGTVALTTLYPGEQIVSAKFGTSAAPTTALQIPDGMVAVSVNLTDPARVAGFVEPGSQVAVFYIGSGQSGAFTRVLLPKVTVLGVGSTTPVSTTTTDTTGESTTEQLPRTLMTLGVSQRDAEKILYAESNAELAFGLLTDKSVVKADADPGMDVQGLFK